MKRNISTTILICCIFAIFLMLGFGVWHISKVLNGETTEQQETMEKAKEAIQESNQALDKATQWHNDLYKSINEE